MNHREAPEALGWEGIGAIVILLVAAAAPNGWLPQESVGLFLFRMLWWLMYLAAATRLGQQFGAAWLQWTVRQQPALCALLALSFASSVWSLAPALTLQKATSLLGTTVLGVFIGHACSPRRLMRVLQWTFALLILSSVAAVLWLPAPIANEWEKIGWRGIMGHRNSFGAAAVWAVLFFLVITLRQRVHPIWGAVFCAMSLLSLAQARSRTSFVALGVSLLALAYAAIAWDTRRPTRAMLRRMSLALVVCVSVLPFFVRPLAAALGNNDPLSGRTRLWAGALAILHERPLTGYGYGAVWGRAEATLLPHIGITAHRSANSAHNSIVNVATELGLPAAILACVYLFGALYDAAWLLRRQASAFSLFALVFMVGFAVMGFAEAHMLRIHSIFWILFVAVTIAVKRAPSDGTSTSSSASKMGVGDRGPGAGEPVFRHFGRSEA